MALGGIEGKVAAWTNIVVGGTMLGVPCFLDEDCNVFLDAAVVAFT